MFDKVKEGQRGHLHLSTERPHSLLYYHVCYFTFDSFKIQYYSVRKDYNSVLLLSVSQLNRILWFDLETKTRHTTSCLDASTF